MSRRKLMHLWFILLWLGMGSSLAACQTASLRSEEQNPPPQFNLAPPAHWPTTAWPTGEPGAHGFSDELSTILDEHAAQLPFLDSLLVIRHGVLVYERYANGYTASDLHDIASVTKSWTSAGVGIAHAAGLLPDLDATLPALLPAYFANGAYADKRAITLRHLLQMRSGLAFDEDTLNSGGYGGEELLQSDLTALALDFPVAQTPGTSWNYSTLDTQLISAIVEEAAGLPLAGYVARELFAPLGIQSYDWWSDGTGTTIGGQNLSMSPRDMAKLGLLYLHGGRWEDRQLVPESWVALSITPQNEHLYYPPTQQTEHIEWQGYHWWTWNENWFWGYRTFQAAGYAGQQVLVFPELDLIVVTTANLSGVDIATEIAQRTAIHELIHDVLGPALTDKSPRP